MPTAPTCPSCAAPLSPAEGDTAVACRYCGKVSVLASANGDTSAATAAASHARASSRYTLVWTLTGILALTIVGMIPAIRANIPADATADNLLSWIGPTCLADVNGDDALDAIGTTMILGHTDMAFVAIDGATGSVLWHSPYPIEPGKDLSLCLSPTRLGLINHAGRFDLLDPRDSTTTPLATIELGGMITHYNVDAKCLALHLTAIDVVLVDLETGQTDETCQPTDETPHVPWQGAGIVDTEGRTIKSTVVGDFEITSDKKTPTIAVSGAGWQSSLALLPTDEIGVVPFTSTAAHVFVAGLRRPLPDEREKVFEIHILDRLTGVALQSRSVTAFAGPGLMDLFAFNGRYLIATNPGGIRAIDPESGAVMWWIEQPRGR